MGSPTRAILCRPHHLSTPVSRSKEKAYLTRLSLKTSCQPQPLPQQDRAMHPPIPLVLMRTAQKDSSGHLLMACAPVHLSQEVSSRGLERVTRLLINVSIRLLHPPRDTPLDTSEMLEPGDIQYVLRPQLKIRYPQPLVKKGVHPSHHQKE